MTIVGLRTTSFTAQDGTQITGTTVYVTEPIPAANGEGVSCDHFFLSSKRLAALDFKLAVGQQIEVLYNKFGKPASINLVPELDY